MRAGTAYSIHCEPWRAGFEVGRALAGLAPEVVLLFATINYESDFPALLDGLEEGLGNPGSLVFGCTGDSVMEAGQIFNVGVTGLGLTAQGDLRWSLRVEPEARDGRKAATACAHRVIQDLGGTPDLAFVLADGLRSDGGAIAEALNQVLACPFLGGLAADDRRFERTFVFAEGRAWPEAVAVLAARGPVRSAIHSASGIHPLEGVGVVDRCEGGEVLRIDGGTAQDFLRARLGKAASEVDLGSLPLAVKVPGDHFVLRSPWKVDVRTGALRVFGSLAPGTEVRACHVNPEMASEGVHQCLERIERIDFQPDFALAVSCAGRRWLFGDRYDEAVRVLGRGTAGVPSVGFLSFGEIGPFLESTTRVGPAWFHNLTLVLGVFGA